MTTPLTEMLRPGGSERVVIAKRTDGTFTYFKQFRSQDGNWSAPGPDAGVFDSALTAETEAMLRVPWLAARRQ